MLRLLTLLIGLLIFPAQAGVTAYMPVSCDDAVPHELMQRAEITCGTVTAPLDPSDGDAGTHQLFVVHIRTVVQPHPDPIVFLSGGPGVNISAYWPFITAMLDSGLTDFAGRDLIVYDQRGVGLSQPSLGCHQEEAAANRIQMNINRLCAARLGESHNLVLYNTVNNAADVEAIRLALGLETLNLYGHSYGTRLALTVMRQHPQAVRSVLLEGVFPPNARFLALPTAVDGALTRVFNACAADAACAAAYGNLDVLFSETYTAIQQAGAVSNFDEYAFVNVIYYLLESSRADKPSRIPQFIFGFHQTNLMLIVPALQQAVDTLPPDNSIYEGVMSLVNCSNEAPMLTEAFLSTANPDVRPEIMRVIGESLRQQFIENCRNWDYARFDASHQSAVTSDIPTLIFNGTFDQVTPIEYAYQAAETLTRATVVPFDGWGHWILGHGNACATAIYADFLNAPDAAPDTTCAAPQPIPFALP